LLRWERVRQCDAEHEGIANVTRWRMKKTERTNYQKNLYILGTKGSILIGFWQNSFCRDGGGGNYGT